MAFRPIKPMPRHPFASFKKPDPVFENFQILGLHPILVRFQPTDLKFQRISKLTHPSFQTLAERPQ